MQTHEYKVIPAPRRGEKIKGAKTVAERFGVALAHLMNELAAEGWEYLRADTLPCDERTGLTGTATHYHAMLVFRREIRSVAEDVRTLHEQAPRSVPSMDDLIPEAIEPDERTVLSPVINTPAGPAPALGPADGAAWRPNGRS